MTLAGTLVSVIGNISSNEQTGLPRLCAGDWVEVRSRDEILATLDKDGRLDGMPFMPEMFAFCGKRFRVYKPGCSPSIRPARVPRRRGRTIGADGKSETDRAPRPT